MTLSISSSCTLVLVDYDIRCSTFLDMLTVSIAYNILIGDFLCLLYVFIQFSFRILGMPSCLEVGSCWLLLLDCDIFNINCDIRDGQSLTEIFYQSCQSHDDSVLGLINNNNL
jgi:hypothetical protein